MRCTRPPTRHVAFLLLTSLLLTIFTGCEDKPPVATVDGPEAVDLIAKIKGHIVTDDTGDITAISLPEKTARVVHHFPRAADGMGPIAHALSGPDRNGLIAYIEDYFFVNDESEKRHLLKTVRVDGTDDTEIFSRPGSAMWATTASGKGEIGSHLALAPTGELAAFISHVANKQMAAALLNVGNIEIWNLKDKTGSLLDIVALDEPMSWFPDGQRLAYSTLVARKDLPNNAAGLAEFGTYLGNKWDQIPAIYVYDLKSRKSEFFCVGWQPIVACDGQFMIVGGWGDKDFFWRHADINTRESTALKLPGAIGPVLGMTPEGFTLYVALPTKGVPIEFTQNNSALRGPKEVLTIKVADKSAEHFQTIVPHIDPRSHASFGASK